MKNQSNDMKTEIQTYFIEEIIELVHDNDSLDEWKSIADELGLVGQDNLTSGEKSPIPFMYLKSGMVNVFRTLCQVSNDIKDFNRTPIPLEILRLAKLSINEDYFSKIEVWYDDKSPDPVVIGINEEWVIRKKK